MKHVILGWGLTWSNRLELMPLKKRTTTCCVSRFALQTTRCSDEDEPELGFIPLPYVHMERMMTGGRMPP